MEEYSFPVQELLVRDVIIQGPGRHLWLFACDDSFVHDKYMAGDKSP